MAVVVVLFLAVCLVIAIVQSKEAQNNVFGKNENLKKGKKNKGEKKKSGQVFSPIVHKHFCNK